MNITNVTTKKMLENRFRVKVNKCPLKKAAQMSWMDIHSLICIGCRMLNKVAHMPAMTR